MMIIKGHLIEIINDIFLNRRREPLFYLKKRQKNCRLYSVGGWRSVPPAYRRQAKQDLRLEAENFLPQAQP